MIDILILYELHKKVLTMYGITQNIKKEFAVLMIPSIGTVKPALNKLEASGHVSSQKFMSRGGRPSRCYSITQSGEQKLTELMTSPLPVNPIQLLVNARIRLYCAQILSEDKLNEMLKLLKRRTEEVLAESKKSLEIRDNDFYPKVVFDNVYCEYKNFLSLLEGVENACKH